MSAWPARVVPPVEENTIHFEPESAPIRSPELFAVEIRTSQWERLVTWYREVLGLRVAVRVVEDRYALLLVGASRLAILGRDECGSVSKRLSLVFEVADLDLAEARLKLAQAPVARRVAVENLAELQTADPDGNSIRLFAWGGSV